MSKSKTVFFCQHCGYETPRWLGKCPSCNQWNSFVEELLVKEDGKKQKQQDWKQHDDKDRNRVKTITLAEVEVNSGERLITADAELNRVLGGGVVPGSLVLVAGEPGIGKSTLFLQNALALK